MTDKGAHEAGVSNKEDGGGAPRTSPVGRDTQAAGSHSQMAKAGCTTVQGEVPTDTDVRLVAASSGTTADKLGKT